MKLPEKVPVKGFYYHYKHDPKGPVENYAYEVVGVGKHTEAGCRPEDAYMVVYQPLYMDMVFFHKVHKRFYLRPLKMFMGKVRKNGKTIPRFKRITNQATISALALHKFRML